MKQLRFLLIGAMVVGVALGIAIGPIFAATTASAQSPKVAHPGIWPADGSLWEAFLDNLAAALNIQRATLDGAITTAGNRTIDDAVQQGKLTQAQGDALKSRLQNGDIGVLRGRGRIPGPAATALRDLPQAMLEAAAQKLGMTTTELLTQLRSGQTLAQIAQAKGTTEQAVIDAALAAAKTRLNQAVTDGDLTQAQADTIYTQLEQKGSRLFTPRGRGFHGRGWWVAPLTPTPTPSSTT
jgi:hypothetical protein